MPLYFAYGSNMDWPQMQGRCPSARFVCVAKLKDHRLDFTRESKERGCGVADAVSEVGADVWGVVYEIDDRDLGRLDRCEGYDPLRLEKKNAYIRRECHVLERGCEGKPLTVFAYFAIRQPNPPPPNVAYKQLIVEGAKHWHLPEEYIRRLEAIKTK